MGSWRSMSCAPYANFSVIFETRTATERGHFACQDGGVSKIFIIIISNGEKNARNVNVVVSRQDKRESSSLPVAVRSVIPSLLNKH